MNKHDQTGFTLVEIMLYLAVVGLVFMIGINAVSGRSSQVQHTDSMRDLHGYIKAQYSEFVSGVKPLDIGCRYTSPPTSSYQAPNLGTTTTSDGSCILFGKVFIFDTSNTKVSTYDLVARNITDPAEFGISTCNAENLLCLDPTVINFITPETYQILWGTRFTAGNESTHLLFGNGNITQLISPPTNRNNDNVRGFGWLRVPATSKIIPIVFGATPPTVFTAVMLNDYTIYRSHAYAAIAGAPARAQIGDFNSGFCFRGPGGQPGMLVFGEGESQEVIALNFEELVLTHDCSSF